MEEVGLKDSETIFGAKLDTDDLTIDDLFSFNRSESEMDLERGPNPQKKTSNLMNAFVHQGELFSKDPFSFNPSIPETYKPFQFNF